MKYKAVPNYDVDAGDIRIKFDHAGEYETDDAKEIAVLDGLVPTWITKLDETKPQEDAKPKARATSAR